jgi:hypothetical protein
MVDRELTREEKNAIQTLKRLAKRWPASLWLFSGNGELNVMRYTEDGDRGRRWEGSIDPEYIVATIKIDNDGGDW